MTIIGGVLLFFGWVGGVGLLRPLGKLRVYIFRTLACLCSASLGLDLVYIHWWKGGYIASITRTVHTFLLLVYSLYLLLI
jgi:hypothetical protein